VSKGKDLIKNIFFLYVRWSYRCGKNTDNGENENEENTRLP
jgi:hypothetical protein